jgi:hypothetical protein
MCNKTFLKGAIYDQSERDLQPHSFVLTPLFCSHVSQNFKLRVESYRLVSHKSKVVVDEPRSLAQATLVLSIWNVSMSILLEH